MKPYLLLFLFSMLGMVCHAQATDTVPSDTIVVPVDSVDIPTDTIDIPADTIPADTIVIQDSLRLPRIILHNDTALLTTFTSGFFTLITDTDTIAHPILLRHRGAGSLRYDKPSLAVKMLDSIGEKMNVSFFGMRSDNYWILDAMAPDKARMRNRAAMDLWLEIAPPVWYAKQEPEALNGYRGEMVEVWFDSVPMGVYCLMERIDRKQLKLKKYSEDKGIRGLLYKTVKWSDEVSFNRLTSIPTPSMAAWQGWEYEYPDYEDGEPIDWEPLVNLIRFVWKSNTSVFADSLGEHIDMPTYINYCLLVNMLSARDNAGKNNYWSFYDIQKSERALVSFWDIDHSWGRMYNSKEEPIDYIRPESNLLYDRCRAEYPGFVEDLEQRYAELRRSAFTINHLDSLLDRYFTRYAQTGMDTLEARLWSGHNDIVFDIPSEQEYIHNWLLQRLDFLDEYYHYHMVTTSLEGVNATDAFRGVYDLLGRYVSDHIHGLPGGIYIYRHDGKTEKVRIVDSSR